MEYAQRLAPRDPRRATPCRDAATRLSSRSYPEEDGDNLTDVAAVLAEAANMVRRGHVQRANAQDARGRDVLPHEKEARRWSITGALLAAGRSTDGKAFTDALVAFGAAIGIFDVALHGDWSILPSQTRKLCERIWEWEDRPFRTATHVLDAFERAIKETI